MWDDHEESWLRKDSNSIIKPQLSEIASRKRPSGSSFSAPSHTRATTASSTKGSPPDALQIPDRSTRTPPQNHQKQASTCSTGTSLTITPPLFYAEDILPMEEEEVGDMRWVGFVTLVDQKGGQYRQRTSTPTAYGGFSDIWQCDSIFSDGSNVVVGPRALCVGVVCI